MVRADFCFYESRFIIYQHVGVQLFQWHLLKRLFFLPLDGLGTVIENQLTIDTWFYFWTPSSLPLIYMSILFMSVPHCLDHHCFFVSFEIKKCESSYLVILFKVVLALLGLLQFDNFRICLPISTKKSAKILIEIVLNL